MKWLFAALLALASTAGCTDQTDLLPSDGGADACEAPGSPVQLGGSCAGALAAPLFRRALCSCSSLVLDRGLFTEGSSMPGGPGPGGPPIAAVGTDGNVQAGGPVQVAGALQAGGGAGTAFARTSAVFGSLRSAGAIGSNQLLTVGGDAWANGDVLGRVDVNGALHVPDGANLTPGVSASYVVRGPVTVDAPCNCAAGPALDVAAVVQAHATANDDARIGLDANAFAGGTGPAALDLPCGQFYLTALVAPHGLDLHVHGRAALLVGGDARFSEGLRVSFDPGTELDLVIAGNLEVQTGTLGGMPAAAMRLWLGGKSAHFGLGAGLTAAVYAPGTSFASDGDLSVTGAVFAHDFQPTGDLVVRYERGLLAIGGSCGVPTQAPVD